MDLIFHHLKESEWTWVCFAFSVLYSDSTFLVLEMKFRLCTLKKKKKNEVAIMYYRGDRTKAWICIYGDSQRHCRRYVFEFLSAYS